MICKTNIIKQESISGDLNLDAIIEAYKAKGVVNAGDFVKFTTDYQEIHEAGETQIYYGYNHSGNAVSAVALDESRVFLTWRYVITTGDSDKGNLVWHYKVLACVVQIEGTTITIGDIKEMKDENIYNSTVSRSLLAVKLSNSKVLILYQSIEGTKKHSLMYMNCSINSTNINLTGAYHLLTSSYTPKDLVVSAVALDESRVFILYAFDGDTSIGLATKILNVTNNTMGETCILLSPTESQTTTYKSIPAIAKLTNDKILIVYDRGVQNSGICFRICTINNMEVTTVDRT